MPLPEQLGQLMYGLPHGLNLGFFARQMLIQVCIGMNELILNFDEGASVTVESSIGFAFDDEPYCRIDQFREAARCAAALLGLRVISASGTVDGTLELVFEGHKKVYVYDDHKEYESYTISNRNELIVV